MMYHLIPLPIIFVAVIVCLVASRYGLKIFTTISKAIIVICVVVFIFTYLDYKGFNIINYIKNFGLEIWNWLK